MRLFVRQDGAKPGDILMREDEELLFALERGDGEPFLRFYEWQVPTISLGYHQPSDALNLEKIAAAGLDWVRRPTGGAAVLHSQELTYAIALPASLEWHATGIQELISRSLADGLKRVGVNARVEQRGEPLSALPNRVSCFVRTSRWEVTANGKKIIGSAQRKLTKAILQHGSILTGDDHLRIVEFLRLKDESTRNALKQRLQERATSVHEETKRAVDMDLLRRAMEQSFLEHFAEAKTESVTGAA